MDYLCSAYCSKITVALIGNDEQVRVGTLQASGDGWRTAMGGLNAVEFVVLVKQYRAADRGNPDRFVPKAHLVNQLADYGENRTVTTAGAVVVRTVNKALGNGVYLLLHYFLPSMCDIRASNT